MLFFLVWLLFLVFRILEFLRFVELELFFVGRELGGFRRRGFRVFICVFWGLFVISVKGLLFCGFRVRI